MTRHKEKQFDCIAFKREAQQRIYEETKDLTPEELLEYFRRKVEDGPFAEAFRAGKASKAA